ncbi:MAG: hypothetical protein CMI09_12215 [Oceanospirillaceae bacterium]|nr:hypothetical protein [Oceanospirillaceae bacterium]|tara:strand:- start:969 stop:1547 length:579 start_codon:yes stop_codon:yes gene_type:complete
MISHTLIHIFKAGSHVSMGGDNLTFTEQDVANIAATYDPAKRPANLTIGHPGDNQPNMGAVVGLVARQGHLFAQVQPNAELQRMVKAGEFKKISAAFYPPNSPENPVPGVYYLRHVGFLGAVPPAIKGLTDPEFSEHFGTVCFSESNDKAAPVQFGENPQSHFEAAKHYEEVMGCSFSEAAHMTHNLPFTYN